LKSYSRMSCTLSGDVIFLEEILLHQACQLPIKAVLSPSSASGDVILLEELLLQPAYLVPA
jgi:hypothetical protein